MISKFQLILILSIFSLARNSLANDNKEENSSASQESVKSDNLNPGSLAITTANNQEGLAISQKQGTSPLPFDQRSLQLSRMLHHEIISLANLTYLTLVQHGLDPIFKIVESLGGHVSDGPIRYLRISGENMEEIEKAEASRELNNETRSVEMARSTFFGFSFGSKEKGTTSIERGSMSAGLDRKMVVNKEQNGSTAIHTRTGRIHISLYDSQQFLKDQETLRVLEATLKNENGIKHKTEMDQYGVYALRHFYQQLMGLKERFNIKERDRVTFRISDGTFRFKNDSLVRFADIIQKDLNRQLSGIEQRERNRGGDLSSSSRQDELRSGIEIIENLKREIIHLDVRFNRKDVIVERSPGQPDYYLNPSWPDWGSYEISEAHFNNLLGPVQKEMDTPSRLEDLVREQEGIVNTPGSIDVSRKPEIESKLRELSDEIGRYRASLEDLQKILVFANDPALMVRVAQLEERARYSTIEVQVSEYRALPNDVSILNKGGPFYAPHVGDRIETVADQDKMSVCVPLMMLLTKGEK